MVDVDQWASARVTPSNVFVVPGGQSKTAYVYVTANDNALEGQNIFAVSVKEGKNIVEQFTLTANVVPAESADEGSWDSVKRSLEIGLVVLVIILVILGLIIGLNKLRKGDDEDDEAQTYY